MPVRGVSPSQLLLGTFKVFSSYLLIRINLSKLVAFLQFWTRSLFLKYWLSPDFLPCPKAGLARQQGILDPVFTSIVHHGSELCPPSKPETSSLNSLVTPLLYLFILLRTYQAPIKIKIGDHLLQSSSTAFALPRILDRGPLPDQLRPGRLSYLDSFYLFFTLLIVNFDVFLSSAKY